MENEDIEAVVREPAPKNALDQSLTEHGEAKAALESIESREPEQKILHNIMLKEGDGKEVVGQIVYKDRSNGIVQTSKNVGYRFDAEVMEGHEINERVAVVMVGDKEKAITESEYNRNRENERALAVEVDNDAAATSHLDI
ncbi:MAG: hypothetical protein L0G63_04105 [Psychrobacter sp.]|uniref:hypothetical protein n=1 Tax=Psychrobacter sp. TaxID=56811 RepID=UPI002648B96F|nr:hypothetical protein [Psychrobacter sp.]MDN5619659.1 hypothetical protein [Psychrobacter sp.]